MGARMLTLAAIAMLSAWAGGCRQECTTQVAVAAPMRADLIFNPSWNGTASDARRGVWPATNADTPLWDQTDFATFVRDTQYPPVNSLDGYYRRFEAVRWGRVVR